MPVGLSNYPSPEPHAPHSVSNTALVVCAGADVGVGTEVTVDVFVGWGTEVFVGLGVLVRLPPQPNGDRINAPASTGITRSNRSNLIPFIAQIDGSLFSLVEGPALVVLPGSDTDHREVLVLGRPVPFY